jgi:hypothetical protein
MCKEMPVNRVVDKKRIIGKIWRAKEEERHKVPQKGKKINYQNGVAWKPVPDFLDVLHEELGVAVGHVLESIL